MKRVEINPRETVSRDVWRVERKKLLAEENDRVFHTYSMYARGAETVGGSYYWLDLTALGRQEDWEVPKDRVTDIRGASPNFSE